MRLGLLFDQRFELLDQRGTVAIEGHHVGHLGAHSVANLDLATLALVHRGYLDTPTKGGAFATLQSCDLLDHGACTDAVVGYIGAYDAGPATQLDYTA